MQASMVTSEEESLFLKVNVLEALYVCMEKMMGCSYVTFLTSVCVFVCVYVCAVAGCVWLCEF